MAWAVNFNDISLDEKIEFLGKYLEMNSDKVNMQKAYREVLSFIVGGLYVCPKYRYVSIDADNLLKKNGYLEIPHTKKSKNPPLKELTIEHTIPTKLMVDYLLSKDKSELSRQELKHIFTIVSGTALITKKENNLLRENKLNHNLPDGITVEDIIQGQAKHSCRYDYINIQYKEFNPYD